MEVFRLFLFGAIKLNVSQFAHAIYKVCHLGTKLRANVIFSDACIFDHIVQQRRHDAFVVHTHASQHGSDG